MTPGSATLVTAVKLINLKAERTATTWMVAIQTSVRMNEACHFS